MYKSKLSKFSFPRSEMQPPALENAVFSARIAGNDLSAREREMPQPVWEFALFAHFYYICLILKLAEK